MKILVYPHDLDIGGSQLNAIEIAAKVAELGHEVLVFGYPGPLTARIQELGLRFLPSPRPRRRPSRAVVGELRRIIAQEKVDIVHGYEWPPALEAFLACRGHKSASAVATVMSMAVAPFLPRAMPLLVGTEQIAEAERRSGRANVATLEPPVDLDENNAAALHGPADFRLEWGIPADGLTLVTVTRLAQEMKLEGILVAMDAMDRLPSVPEVTLVIVGDGQAREQVQARAEEVNARMGRRAIVLTGEMMDPRAAYAAGDVLFGMGGSALRSLAFGKPLVVQGEQGFWKRLSAETVEEFLWTGWYGVGRDAQEGVDAFVGEIVPLLGDAAMRADLGEFGRELVERRFSLQAAAARQLDSYQDARNGLRMGPVSRFLDSIRSAAMVGRYTISRRLARALGRAALDDFNSRPVVMTGPARPAGAPGRT